MATNKSEKQVMDISKPGKSAPSASAKPVIVGHKPMVQDPMVTSDVDPETEKNDENTAQEVAEVSSPSASKKVISPMTDVGTDEEKSEPEVPDNPREEPEPQVEEQASAEAPEAAVVDAVLDLVGEKKNQEINEEDRKKQEHLDKLIEEKKYFIPIGKTHGKSSNFFIISLLLLILVVAGIVAAIDAELIDLGFNLPFDILTPQ